VGHQEQQGLRFAWVGADGFYGQDPAFLRGVEAMGKVFVADLHCDQRIDLDDPQPVVQKKKGKRGRNPTLLEPQAPSVRVDEWAKKAAARGVEAHQGTRQYARRIGSRSAASARLVMGW
jgi:SRSO17 transposase